MALAEKEGLLENVDAKADDILMRGNMAVMTLNALGATVKGTGNTLADELNIKLPVPAKLEVEDVYADNLKEVKVVTNGAEITEDALKVENYSLKRGAKIEEVVVDGNNLVLVLKDEANNLLVNKKDDVLTIKGTKNIDGKYDLKVYDNEVPYVVAVESLGTKAIKVTMSEPVKKPQAKDFKLDGKTFFGRVNAKGRELTLIPYGSRLEVGEHELVVGKLNDYANFTSVETLEKFEVVEDTVAPEVVSVTGTLEYVVVEFSEDVDVDTVTKDSLYWNKKANKANSITQLSGNRFKFNFKEALPLYEVTLNIQNVKDYSGNKMDAVEIAYKGELDETRPEVVEVKVNENNAKELEVTFTKELKDDVKGKYFVIKDEKDKTVTVKKAELNSENKKVVNVELFSELKADEEYTIKIEALQDNTKLNNTMIPYEGTIKRDAKVSPAKFEGVAGVTKTREFIVVFSKEMDIETMVDPSNYIIYNSADGKGDNKMLSAIEDVEIELYEGRKSVKVTLPKGYSVKEAIDTKDFIVQSVSVLSVKDTDGKLVSNYNTPKNIDSETIKIKEAKATSKTEVVVEFTGKILDAEAKAFGGNIDVKSVEKIDGNKVTLKVAKLTSNAKFGDSAATIKVVDNDKISGLITSVDQTTQAKNIEDKIAPSVKEDGVKVVGKTIEITFDENLENITNAELAANDIILKVVDTNDILVPGTDYKVAANNDKVVVTIEPKGHALIGEKTGLEVSIKGARHIKDLEDNVIADFDGANVEYKSDVAVKSVSGDNGIVTVKFNRALLDNEKETVKPTSTEVTLDTDLTWAEDNKSYTVKVTNNQELEKKDYKVKVLGKDYDVELGVKEYVKVTIEGDAIETTDYTKSLTNLEKVEKGTDLKITAVTKITVNGKTVENSASETIKIDEAKTITINKVN